MNKIILTGVCGKEPAISVSKDGMEMAKFSLAVKREGNREVTDWFNCIVFGKIATSLIKPFVHKGSKLMIIGNMQFSSYEKNGQKMSGHSVVVREIELNGSKSNGTEEKVDVEDEKVENETTINLPAVDETVPF
ncbi:MAG: single-stranded DNA-binding protein [Clostridia bacterium]|jgi:single-strand DNA-binding protein|nr:single-stranded DNA-binding protein [Clostridia bacterium]